MTTPWPIGKVRPMKDQTWFFKNDLGSISLNKSRRIIIWTIRLRKAGLIFSLEMNSAICNPADCSSLAWKIIHDCSNCLESISDSHLKAAIKILSRAIPFIFSLIKIINENWTEISNAHRSRSFADFSNWPKKGFGPCPIEFVELGFVGVN